MTSVGTVIAASTLVRTFVYACLVSHCAVAVLRDFDEAIYTSHFWVLHQRISVSPHAVEDESDAD